MMREETAEAAFAEFAEAATFKRRGESASTPCRVITDHSPNDTAEGFASEWVSTIQVLTKEIASVSRGDEFTIGANRYRVISPVGGDGVIETFSASRI